jgi:hypothetical protein
VRLGWCDLHHLAGPIHRDGALTTFFN